MYIIPQRFPTRRAAELEAQSRGLVTEGDDHLISIQDEEDVLWG